MKIDKSNPFLYPQPENDNVLVWRYYDFPKFISLLDKRQLFLSRVDLLKDLNEGSFTDFDAKILDKVFDYIGKPEMAKKLPKFRQLIRKYTYVNCWHMNDNDSQAMWLLYCGASQGVAIQTTYGKLRDCINDNQMAIGLVRYIDHKKHFFGFDKQLFESLKKNQNLGYEGYNLHGPFMHKLEAFAHEQEVRIVKTLLDKIENTIKPEQQEPGPKGIALEIELEKVIEKIYVHPYSQSWYFDVVKSIVSKYAQELCENVKWAPMRKEPIY